MTIAEITTTGPFPGEHGDAETAMPEEIRVGNNGAVLTLTWADGSAVTLPASVLRENSRSAVSKKLRLSSLNVPTPSDVTIKALQPIGSYAINITFSDGYDRGIYPWTFLQQLADGVEDDQSRRALTPEDFLKGN